MRKTIPLLLFLIFSLAACNLASAESATPEPVADTVTPVAPTATATETPTPSLTPTVTETPLPTFTPTITNTPYPTDAPEKELPLTLIDSGLGDLEHNYYKIVAENGSYTLPVFAAAEDVVDFEVHHELETSSLFINCETEATASNGIEMCYLEGHGWVQKYRFSPAFPDDFEGVQVNTQPATDFGWVVQRGLTPYKAAGFYEPLSSQYYERYDIVRIFEEKLVGKTTWYRVGENQWAPATTLSVVDVNKPKPSQITTSHWIMVDIWEQVLTVYENNQLIFATLVSTGDGYKLTDTGLYAVYLRFETTTMSGGEGEEYYLLERVPWTMYFDGGNALHGAYWHSSFGYPRTHGCVNLALADAHWLFDWASENEYVYVYDSREEE
ncbi:MAG: L,D-transpeptidase [Anaerolineae bacterium]|jgi:lipoprotein-anchoring transpeptidase ErfK/SrfK|nr:L,D-transpeptidase [Anaerolineae bacterium]